VKTGDGEETGDDEKNRDAEKTGGRDQNKKAPGQRPLLLGGKCPDARCDKAAQRGMTTRSTATGVGPMHRVKGTVRPL